MVEEQIDVKGLVPHFERKLAPDEGEAAAQFQEQIAKMDQKPAFDLRLLRLGVTVRKSKL